MKRPCLFGMALAGILACGQLASAQPAIITPIQSSQQTFTTGMLGFTGGQTARLNVLNLNAVNTAAATQASCSVALQFFDAQNNPLKSETFSNIAPQTAASLDLANTAATPAIGHRSEIRGVVVVNPTTVTVGTTALTDFCNVVTTLEIFDNTSGATVALTSDTRAVGSPFAVPLLTAVPR
jgi:hypothetical protein